MLNAGNRPKVRPGDYERALELLSNVGGDKVTRKYLGELIEAKLAYDESETKALSAIASAKTAEANARQTEERAEIMRRTLASETADSDESLKVKRVQVSNDLVGLDAWTKRNETTDAELNRRESALRRAFDAYTKGE